ncbi:Bst1p [Nakaseomyces bracarensis]|uniref:Bst1p n=1 Tax=Nakaseomyces bracarensis TaxID=273131 RepID=UPI0038718028
MSIRKIFAGLSRKLHALPTNINNRTNLPNKSDDDDINNKTFIDKNLIDEQWHNDFDSYENKYKRNRIYKRASILGLILFVVLALITAYWPLSGVDLPKCQSIYMYPSYAKVESFDERYTPLAKKYHLFLYREQDLDKNPIENEKISLNGVPVLFIPGNAGSYRQVRSIASACSELYFKNSEELKNKDSQNLDFFAADFNEDFTAFHGGTMLDQAEYLNDAIRYILSLYDNPNNIQGSAKPRSVIILAHSMGGIVARVMPTLKNHIQGSVHSYITLSSPHAAAPVTFDGDILQLYKQANKFWRTQINDKESFISKNVSLISITGGIQDTILPADYAAIEDIIPYTNGFTTHTNTIQEVWTPIDHLAIVWCRQLRKVIAKYLLESVDKFSESKIKSLNERINLASHLFLSGFEDFDTPLLPYETTESHELTDTTIFQDFQDKDILKITNENYPSDINHIIKVDQFSDKVLSIFTNIQKPLLYGCDYDTTNGSKYICQNIDYMLNKIPKKFSTDEETDTEYNRLLELNISKLKKYDIISFKFPELDPSFKCVFYATVKNIQKEEINIHPWTFLFKSLKLKTNPGNIVTTWNFPHLWDSIIAYKIRVNTEAEKLDFSPLMRQSLHEPFETKWHINILDTVSSINFHNIAPYIPLNKTVSRPLMISIITPVEEDFELRMDIDWIMSLKLLYIRYRLAIASLPIAVISLVLALQFFLYNKYTVFISFDSALAHLISKYIKPLLTFILVLSPIVNIERVQQILFVIDPAHLNKPYMDNNKDIVNNFFVLGLRSAWLSSLGIFFSLMAVGLVSLLYFTISVLLKLFVLITNKFLSTNNIKTNTRSIITKWRLISISLLLLSITIYIPYQMAFIIALVIQVINCIKSSMIQKKSLKYANLTNFNNSILILFIFIAIINAPIIIVFIHNVAIHWETTFRSQHNCMAIIPILLLVNNNSLMRMPNISDNKRDNIITVILFIYLSVFSLLYGVRNLYWLHHGVNIISLWLFYLTIFSKGR